jgi:hypothetical protein
MEHANGQADGSTSEFPVLVNGHHPDGLDEPTLEDLERELPVVYDGQVPLSDLLSRVVQSIYAELCELAETCVCWQTRLPPQLTLGYQHAKYVRQRKEANSG